MLKPKIVHLFLFLLIVLSIIVQFAGFMNGIDWGDDFAAYIIQAQTLIDGDFKGLEANIQRNDYILNYPWGFPILLAPVIKFFGTDFMLIKKYVFLFFIAGLFITYLAFRQKKEEALLTILLMAASPYFWFFKNLIGSDFPNMFCVLLSLLLMQKTLTKRETIFNSWIDNCLIGFTIYLSFTMRTQSFILLVTLAILQIIYLKRDLLKPKILIIAALPHITFIILKYILETLIPVEVVTYSQTFINYGLFDTLRNNLFYYINIWKDLFKDVSVLQNIDGIVTGICAFLSLTGIFVRWKENLVFITFIVLQLGLLLIYPFHQDLRFLIPIIPFFFYFMVVGVFHLSELLYENRSRLWSYLFLSPLLALSFYSTSKLTFGNFKNPVTMEGPYNYSAIEMFDYLKKNTSTSSLIGQWKPRVALLFTERNCITPTTVSDCIRRKTAYYVYYRNAYTEQISLDSISKYPRHFRNVFENEDYKVFRVIADPSKADPEQEKPEGLNELAARIDHKHFNNPMVVGRDTLTFILSDEGLSSLAFPLKRGRYLLDVYSKSTKAKNIYPLNKVLVNEKVAGTFQGKERPHHVNLPFELANDTTVGIRLKMENDLYDNESGEDRNIILYFINIYKTR